MSPSPAAAPEPISSESGFTIDLNGRRVQLHPRRRGTVVSPHTGRPLVELHAWATTADATTHAWLSEALKAAAGRPVTAYDDAEEHLGNWHLSWNAYGEAAGVHTYTLILRECEDLNLEALVVNGTELHPYEYREEAVPGGLTVWAKLVGAEEDVLRLRRELRSAQTVQVVRRGIQDTPRRMRLGVGEWSEFEDRVKYRLVLVEDGVDESGHPELARIRRENGRAALGFYMNFAERLVGLLVAKGVLEPAEVEAVREAASFDPVVARHDFWRVVADIDDR